MNEKKIYAHEYQTGFQFPNSPSMEGIINLHHDIFAWMIAIIIFVMWMLIRTITLFYYENNKIATEIDHKKAIALEIGWTLVPCFILLSIAIPTFALLYSLDEIIDPVMTLRVIGYQWYWQYEYLITPTLEKLLALKLTPKANREISFESYMVAENDLKLGELRLLEVDNRVVLPTHTHIRILITANDVIHSWAIPSLGIKMDACPGRLNQTHFFTKQNGIYYGQCSEICGVNHGFMPIVVESVPLTTFKNWIASKINK